MQTGQDSALKTIQHQQATTKFSTSGELNLGFERLDESVLSAVPLCPLKSEYNGIA